MNQKEYQKQYQKKLYHLHKNNPLMSHHSLRRRHQQKKDYHKRFPDAIYYNVVSNYDSSIIKIKHGNFIIKF